MLAPQSTAAAFSIGNDRSEMSDGKHPEVGSKCHEQCRKRANGTKKGARVSSRSLQSLFPFLHISFYTIAGF